MSSGSMYGSFLFLLPWVCGLIVWAIEPWGAGTALGQNILEVQAEKYAARTPDQSRRGWVLVDASVPGGELGNGEEKDPNGTPVIPAVKFAGATGTGGKTNDGPMYMQLLRDTGGFWQQPNQGPSLDFHFTVTEAGKFQLEMVATGKDDQSSTLYVQLMQKASGNNLADINPQHARWYRVTAPSKSDFTHAAITQGGRERTDVAGNDQPMAWQLRPDDYTLRITARADGVALDRWSLTRVASAAAPPPKAAPTPSASAPATEPPGLRWTPQYKLPSGATQSGNPADIVGEDGIAYPDFRYAGVPGGIPQITTVVRASDFGARPDDGADDHAGLIKAIEAVVAQGGGVVQLEAGVYDLKQPLVITHDRVVIRGAGREATLIRFDYLPAEIESGKGVAFFDLKAGQTVGPDEFVVVHARPEGLRALGISADGKTQRERKWHFHWGGTFDVDVAASVLLDRLGPGEHELTAWATYEDGSTVQSVIKVKLDPSRRVPEEQRRWVRVDHLGAITFQGASASSKQWRLAADGKRGDTVIELAQAVDLKPGDTIEIQAPATTRWHDLVKNACREWGVFRRYELLVTRVDGSKVTVNQPLRIDYPVIDGSFIARIYPLRYGGVEDLSLEQVTRLWTDGVLFENVWGGWVRNIKVTMAGRDPVSTQKSKWCEVRDSQFSGAWYFGGGGTAYVGFATSYDCLMINVQADKQRHGPIVQWSAAGNVFSQCRFVGMDMQWHAGWTNENLFENVFVDARGEHGSYGCGAWASPPEDKAHGPNGPRNVVYNNHVLSSRDGLWVGGMNENWIIAHNLFHVRGDKPGMFFKDHSFDHIIVGNVIALESPRQPALELKTADCVGVEFKGNRIMGGRQAVTQTAAPLAVDRDNQRQAYDPNPARPTPAVASIYQWQLDNKPLPGDAFVHWPKF